MGGGRWVATRWPATGPKTSRQFGTDLDVAAGEGELVVGADAARPGSPSTGGVGRVVRHGDAQAIVDDDSCRVEEGLVGSRAGCGVVVAGAPVVAAPPARRALTGHLRGPLGRIQCRPFELIVENQLLAGVAGGRRHAPRQRRDGRRWRVVVVVGVVVVGLVVVVVGVVVSVGLVVVVVVVGVDVVVVVVVGSSVGVVVLTAGEDCSSGVSRGADTLVSKLPSPE